MSDETPERVSLVQECGKGGGTVGRPPPPWIDWGDDEEHTGHLERFITAHANWFMLIVVVAVLGAFGALMAIGVGFSGHEPGLVYDPPVVHRTITTNDGRTVDCAVSHGGMSCDWGHSR